MSAATLAARAWRATVAEAQARLGHSTVRAAMSYQHAETARQADIAAALSAMAESAAADGSVPVSRCEPDKARRPGWRRRRLYLFWWRRRLLWWRLHLLR